MPLHVSVNDKSYKHHAYAGPEAGAAAGGRKARGGRRDREQEAGDRRDRVGGPRPRSQDSFPKGVSGKN